ncbi:hypothetical protein BKA70DRAFT_1272662 [Coprinopsis sp. MPI-PUGE-AT-0042]|nr:hypothetical protein BKA70DRAFT_1272662 [Coprinopsis sp. MPI-PUGE-AT-0042]
MLLSASELTRDPTYFSDTVEGHLFQVTRARFATASPSFTETHNLNCAEWSSELDGFSEGKPIVVPDVKAGEFRALLKLLFPRLVYYPDPSPNSDPRSNRMATSCNIALSRKEWITVLRIATLLHFNDYRKLAIDTLDGIIKDPVERITLARENNISAWLVSAFETLITRPASMTEEQASLIGWTTAVRLFIIRDSLTQYKLAYEEHRRSYSNSSKLPAEPEPTAAQVKAIFAQELQKIRDQEEEECIRASENREQALAQLKQKIEDDKLSLAAEEEAVKQKRFTLEEETKRLQEASQGVECSGKKKGRK